jgi:glycerophosphoryl diester phosphodiesterase
LFCFTLSLSGERSLTLAAFFFMCAGAALGAEPVRLIAHRGGMVDAQRPENSAAAAEEAIRRGYWMLEVDVQESKDSHLVMQHNGFKETYGDPRSPGALNWSEIRQLRAKADGSRPQEFAELAALCRNRIQLMIDTKEPSHSRAFYATMELELRKNGLLDGAYFIGTAEARAYFKGKARTSVDAKELERAILAGEDCARLYFLFEHGGVLDEKLVARARQAGVPVVPSVNTYHYFGQDARAAGRADLLRLRALGVSIFQIDSVYDGDLK